MKRARWRSRRGMRELDVLLTRFIDSCYASLSVGEMDDFDTLLDAADVDLYSWLTGRGIPQCARLAQLVTRIRDPGDHGSGR